MRTLAARTLCELQINKVCSPHDNLYRVVTQWQSCTHTHTHTHSVVIVVGSAASKRSSADKDILIEAQSTFATLEGKGQRHSSWNLLNDFFRSRTARTRRDQLISWSLEDGVSELHWRQCFPQFRSSVRRPHISFNAAKYASSGRCRNIIPALPTAHFPHVPPGQHSSALTYHFGRG